MRRGLVLALAALLAGLAVGAVALAARPSAPPSGASSAAPAPSAAALRAAADRALALVDEPRRFGHRVVLAGPRPGVRAATDPRTRRITLFLDPTDAPHRVAHDLAHELGHAFDVTMLTAAERRAYLARRGAPDAPWWPRPGRGDYAVGAGDLAEVFALCHAASPEFRSTLGPRPADPCGMLPPGARAPLR